jgi:hypothetical protein
LRLIDPILVSAYPCPFKFRFYRGRSIDGIAAFAKDNQNTEQQYITEKTDGFKQFHGVPSNK